VTYKPLPACVTVKESPIEGLGLFATKKISKGDKLGITHYFMGETTENDSIVRTPLGGFYNHSDDPNCEKRTVFDVENPYNELYALRQIERGEELTVKYTLYKL